LLVRTALGTRDVVTGLATAAIALISVSAYLIAATRSDRSHDRCGYATLGLAISAAGCIEAAVATNPWFKIAALAAIPIGSGVFLPSFWCLPTLKFSGAPAAAVIAFISAVGSTGGFFGPNIIGYAKRATGSDAGAFVLLAGIGITGAIICMGLRRGNTFKLVAKPLPAA
jgi:ACS family tartrate transporter-like MFS transporter